MSIICDICANPCQWFSYGECDHSICNFCCLRLRALYKTLACPLCKTECPEVVFSRNVKPFSQFNRSQMKRDKKLGIFFEDALMYSETMNLLLFNCPQEGCKVVCGGGWMELKSHIKKTHGGLLLCDLCVAFKKIFVHESILYTPETLKIHYRSGDENDPSFKGHPDCGFCSISFYDSDALYEHCREKHEKCFLCDRQGIRDQYFQQYSALERHFHTEHFPCNEPACLEQKFVVFASDMDLQGHFLEKHADLKTKLKGMPINLEFAYAGGSKRGGGGNRRRNLSSEDVRESIQNIGIGESTSSTSNNNRRSPAGSPSSRRLRAPDGFGTQLSAPILSQTSDFPSYAPRPQVGENLQQPSLSGFPLPQESTPFPAATDQLTPAQNDIFLSGGPEIISAIQKMIGVQATAMARLKTTFWAFKNGTISAESLVCEFVGLVESHQTRKRRDQIVGEMGSLWNRLADTLPEEASDSQIQRALAKKSKKKGLSIEEFEALRRGEPKRSAMLRVWNDRKVEIQQATREIMPRKQNSWAAIDPPSSSQKGPTTAPSSTLRYKESTLVTSSSSSARVLVIKEKGSIVPKRGKGKSVTSAIVADPTPVVDPIPVPAPVVPTIASQVLSSKSTSSSSLSLSRSKSDFPGLPPPPPKPLISRKGSNAVWGSSSSTSSSVEQSEQQPKRKQGKNKGHVLMRFG